jgi:hypothetical protein
MNILVCGTREELSMPQQILIESVMMELVGKNVCIDGGAAGVDSYAHEFASRSLGWGTRRFPADWTRFGKSAGPIRNQQMLDENDVDLVLAFPGPESRGTWDMVERAVKNRIPVRVYPI